MRSSGRSPAWSALASPVHRAAKRTKSAPMRASPRSPTRSSRARFFNDIILELETTDEEVAARDGVCPVANHSDLEQPCLDRFCAALLCHGGERANAAGGDAAGAGQDASDTDRRQPAASKDHRRAAAVELGYPSQDR